MMLLEQIEIERKPLTKRGIPTLLNLGCGDHFHPDWVNLDLVPASSQVLAHDLTSGLPFADKQFDAVYHSHLLEHLTPDDGRRLLEECYRTLKPGGFIRIVVPDLEKIAELYLAMHDRAWNGDETAPRDYDWMKLELLDQMVREESGGRMGQFISNPDISNSDFVRSRIGDEYRVCRGRASQDTDRSGRRRGRPLRRLREYLAKKMVGILLGPSAEAALAEGLFRKNGEVHRWMYDRYSLRQLCCGIGFQNFVLHDALQSGIANFQCYGLDVFNGQVRKPDSLFVECQRPPSR
jgi:predicted SAM-dependent methyltransferase